MTAANVWTRSGNSDNSNNFCLVNTDGNANNNNANNSYAVAPGFHVSPKGWVKCSRFPNRTQNERRGTSLAYA